MDMYKLVNATISLLKICTLRQDCIFYEAVRFCSRRPGKVRLKAQSAISIRDLIINRRDSVSGNANHSAAHCQVKQDGMMA
jgi:hypothetical protein